MHFSVLFGTVPLSLVLTVGKFLFFSFLFFLAGYKCINGSHSVQYLSMACHLFQLLLLYFFSSVVLLFKLF